MITKMDHFFLIACFVLPLAITTSAATQLQPRPKALVIPVLKDTSTLQYIITLNQRHHPISTPVTIDLKTRLLWSFCAPAYTSSHKPFKCNSPQCSLTDTNCRTTCQSPFTPDCTNTDCTLFFDNPFNPNSNTTGQLVSDIIRINSTNGANVGKLVSAPHVLFGCAQKRVQGLAKGVKGIAGFGRSKTSLPSQFSSNFGFSNKFALCLNSNWSTGVVFFGDGRPYRLYPGPDDISTLFSYTPLTTNPTTPTEYFINTSEIIVNQTKLTIYKSLLTINPKIVSGGTKISTVNPYTIMHSSIFNVVSKEFDEQLHKFSLFHEVKRITPIAPFKFCYDRDTLSFTRIGVVVPVLKLVMHSEQVIWTIFGNNLMVDVGNNGICLGLVDGGATTGPAIVIGGYQIENNLVEFDLEENRLGFTSSLQNTGSTTCGNFNFTLV